jgi:peptidoglycan/LPS O-acetylase OafA/YrhL
MTTMSAKPARLPGLDTLRALAIVAVIAYHYECFVSRAPTFGWLSDLGWSGVDLFFVLSGYLIGQQLLAPLSRGEPASLSRFYARRLLRTLPNYWVVLALYFVVPGWMGGVPRTPAWQFLSFTQNFGLLGGSAFSHAWSLCVEEQFYLLLPLALLVLGAARRPWAVAVGLVALVAACTAGRAWLWQRYGGQPMDYMTHIYYASVARIDEFAPGVALAWLQHLRPQTWRRLREHRAAVGLGGLLLTGFVLWRFFAHDEAADGSRAAFTTVFGYPLLAFGLGLLVLHALQPGSWLNRWRVPGAQWLALRSYALYLVHKPVFAALLKALAPFGLRPDGLLAVPLLIGVSVLVACGLYAAVESPVMAWREHRFPARPRDTPPAVPQPVAP